MRAPFCNETTDLCPDKGLIVSEDAGNDILSVERNIGRAGYGKGAVFGICLDDLMGTPKQVAPHIPFILSRLCRYIEEHGLHQHKLFMEGEEKALVDNLKIEFVECGDAPLEKIGSVASVAKLLIIFFEELPEPLIPISAQSDFIQDIERLSLNSEDTLSRLKVNVENLPDYIYQVLKYLSRFLSHIAYYKDFNGMCSSKLALIFGPLIFGSPSDNPMVVLQLENVVNCFVKDYCVIFADANCSFAHENKMTLITKSSDLSSHKLPSPSMVSLAPLSVVIPPFDNDPERSSKKTPVHILLLERTMTEPDNEKDTCFSFSKYDVDKLGPLITRKRKERRFSWEESQVRSSSEERLNSKTFESLCEMDLMRRCYSHEEVTDDAKMAELDIIDSGKVSENLDTEDSYLSDRMKLVDEENHSPHPPNAKRREVDVSDSDDEPLHCWSYNSMKFTDHKTSLHLADTSSSHVSKQNPVAENGYNNNAMDCSHLEKHPTIKKLELNEIKIPRSASCPVPKPATNSSSESESSSLSLSWSMLFEDSEPVRSENPLNWSPSKHSDTQDDALLSPSVHKLRNSNYYEAPLSPSAYKSYLSHRSSHLDSSVPPSPPVEQEDFAKKLLETTGVTDSVKQLTKKIHCIKKRLRKFDEKFEGEFGYKPSQAEKSNNPEARKMLSDLYKVRKELKALKEEAHLEHVSPLSHRWQSEHILEDTTNHLVSSELGYDKLRPSLEDSFDKTMKSLADQRKCFNRPELVEAMTNEEVEDEKLAIQKALLHFESMHGKPFTREERNTIRPLYDRYRNVKKLLVRTGSFSVSKSKDICNELQPILEHETMDFPSRDLRPQEIAITESEESIPDGYTFEEDTNELVHLKEDTSTAQCCFLTKYDNSNFHELPVSELIFQLQKVRMEKRHIRKMLKEFETEFLRLNGRNVQREDKVPIDAVYGEYKHVKARLRLLEALISKHDQHQLM